MTKKIALLRGINVGGRRKVLMADLRQLLEDIGFVDVKTYIQSGNVIFSQKKEQTNLEIAKVIEKLIADNYEFEVPVVVRTREEWEQAINESPYYQTDMEDISQLHLTFLKEKPTEENKVIAESFDYPPDKFTIKNTEIYILCLGKYHKTKLSNTFFEKKLKVSTTTRNWKTVLKLLELSQ